MPTEEPPPLERCRAMPCPWEADVQGCPHRVQGRGNNRFPKALCRFYSAPGQHTITRIARTVGLSIDNAKEELASAERKMRDAIMNSPELQHDPAIMSMVETHLRSA